MKRSLVPALALALAASGCWKSMEASYLDPDFPNLRVVTIAVLPVLNMTEQPVATQDVLASLHRQLQYEKKYVVLPTAKTMQRLRSGGGGAAFAQMMNQVSMGHEPDPALYGQMARALDADALFQETVVSFSFNKQDVYGASSSGAVQYQQVPITDVAVKGKLWSAHSGQVIWQDHAEQHYFHDVATEGDGSAGPVVDLATHDLLARFPDNGWSPHTPATPTPVPSPVFSHVPFKIPSDPQNP